MQPFGQMTQSDFAALFDYLGVSNKAVCSILQVALSHMRKGKDLDPKSKKALAARFEPAEYGDRRYVSLSNEQLAHATGKSKAAIAYAMNQAVNDGTLRRVVGGVRGLPSVYEITLFGQANEYKRSTESEGKGREVEYKRSTESDSGSEIRSTFEANRVERYTGNLDPLINSPNKYKNATPTNEAAKRFVKCPVCSHDAVIVCESTYLVELNCTNSECITYGDSFSTRKDCY